MLLTETVYAPGMNLPVHSHGSDHLAILLEGSYLEWSGKNVYLCLPGDAIHYGTDVSHRNLFGRRMGRCLNLEFSPGNSPDCCRSNASLLPCQIQMLLRTEGANAQLAAPAWLIEGRRKIDHFPSLTMSTLAAELAIHPSHLAKSFRRAFGMSVGQYATRARVRKGARDLIETETSIAEIAFDAGFYDQSHFTNTFVAVTGFTPAALRNTVHQ